MEKENRKVSWSHEYTIRDWTGLNWIRTSIMDELAGDLVATLTLVALFPAGAVAVAGDMALTNFADLRCASERIGRLVSHGDEEVSEGGSEVDLYECALLFVHRVATGDCISPCNIRDKNTKHDSYCTALLKKASTTAMASALT